jgi:CHAD domain-containing protein
MKQWKRKLDLRDNLQRRLPLLAAEYFQAGRDALGADSNWEQMHRFRLLTKRFRYTLEIFDKAYGPGLTTRIESLRSIQTQLGDINDCIVTSRMLESVAGMQAARESLAAKAEKLTAKLRRYWKVRFDAPGQCERWVRYLGVYACRPKPVPRTRRLPAPPVDGSVT